MTLHRFCSRCMEAGCPSRFRFSLDSFVEAEPRGSSPDAMVGFGTRSYKNLFDSARFFSKSCITTKFFPIAL